MSLRIKSLRHVHLDELLKDQKVYDVEINFIGSSTCDQKKEEADSDLKSMHNNKIMSIFGDDNEEANSDHELSTADEKSIPYSVSLSSPVDIQALIAKAVQEKKNIPTVKIPNVQTLGAMRRLKKIQITKAPRLDPVGHLLRRIDFLATHVHNLGLSLPDKLVDKMDSVVPRIVVDAFKERMLELLSDTLKNILPQLLNDSVKKLMPKFDKMSKRPS
ncbi:hypothetical protein Tco_0272190 [Tanacetum coccineum]